MTTPQRASLVLGTGCWLAYLSLLAPIILYAAIRFDALYSADSLMTKPELSQQYKAFVSLSGIGLAIALGIVAAAFGVWRKSLLQGLLALALGGVTTIMALGIAPPVRFPEDQYAPAALWVMGDGLPLAVTFITATLAGLVIARGKNLETQTSA